MFQVCYQMTEITGHTKVP
ncbi:unnamed protein product [Ranitomeya imitator]|uniref:Uncharacterized protein n=1 Tax=Ranitomeya imitator TaxID=111125 RepID=A0ABN9LYF0_9NEOB|nr:unnamed protein product [Ranitomeya imitator]